MAPATAETEATAVSPTLIKIHRKRLGLSEGVEALAEDSGRRVFFEGTGQSQQQLKNIAWYKRDDL